MALNLAAPHTWPAAIMPTLVAICAAGCMGPVSFTLSLVLLVIVVLMQSSVNTFNDYYDYVKGTDSAEDNVDASDAVLVYNNVNPKSALHLAVGFLVVAFVLGVYAIIAAGPIPLIIALVGAVFVVSYSAGRSPISYLPLGEVVSGVVMGALIPLAVFQVLTGILDFGMLVVSIPTVISIALIMFTNNTCDIERDIPSKRKTLPVLLGRERSRTCYRIALVVWVVSIIAIVAVRYTAGLLIMPCMIAASFAPLRALFCNEFTPNCRIQAMIQIVSANLIVNAFYAAAIAASGFVVVM